MIRVIDNFIPEFETVRDMVMQANFGQYEFMGKPYSGVGQVMLPVRALLEESLGFNIDFVHGHLRLGTKETALTHYIHADTYSQMAMVLYFTEPQCETGTAFWRHKATGESLMPSNAPPDVFAMFDADIEDESKWVQQMFVKAQENRAVLFNSRLFHSRFPRELPIEEHEVPRLVATAFFNRAA